MSISYNVTPEGVAVIENLQSFGQQHLVVAIFVVTLVTLSSLYFFFKYYRWDYL